MASSSTRSSTKRAASQATPAMSSASSTRPQKRSKKETQSTNASSSKSSEEAAKLENTLQIQEETGDIFAAPPNALIIHACNCDGSWRGGIAKAFKDRYPKAYMEYVYHCEEHEHSLFETAQLIPPVDAGVAGEDDGEGDDDEGFEESEPRCDNEKNADTGAPKHFIGCLYTSRHYGRKKDTPTKILAATRPSMEDLLKQVKDWNEKAEPSHKIGEVRMCKINSGLFAVPWEKTKEVLEKIDVSNSEVKVIKVVSPAS